MRKLLPAVLILIFGTDSLAQKELNVMSFNIRLDTPRDSANAWPHRKDFVASQVLFHDTHILGVQEALHHQMQDLQQRLPSFKYVGVARDDGKTRGEYSAIFYDTSRLKLITGATFWLAENPGDTGKRGWDAAITRVATWAKFKDLKSSREFFVFNTHYDHVGKTARKESSKLLKSKVLSIAGRKPVIITGDFNAQPDDEPIRELLEGSAKFTNAKAVSQTGHYGPHGTFNAFGPKETAQAPIDYIFIKNGIQVLKHATLSQTWQGRFSSDHFPVFAVLRLGR